MRPAGAERTAQSIPVAGTSHPLVISTRIIFGQTISPLRAPLPSYHPVTSELSTSGVIYHESTHAWHGEGRCHGSNHVARGSVCHRGKPAGISRPRGWRHPLLSNVTATRHRRGADLPGDPETNRRLPLQEHQLSAKRRSAQGRRSEGRGPVEAGP